MTLHELKLWYSRYHDFWPLWKAYKHNGLSPKDITSIELLRENNFVFNNTILQQFYSQKEILQSLIEPLEKKLRVSYPDYKDWLCLRLQFYFIKQALQYGWDAYFETPIDKLLIDKTVKEQLKKFNCQTTLEITERYSNAHVWNDDTLQLVFKLKKNILQHYASDM
jgi:hypothetical protein